MSYILSKIAKKIVATVMDILLDKLKLSRKQLMVLAFLAWMFITAMIFWFPDNPNSPNIFYWKDYGNPFKQGTNWAFSKVVFPALFGFALVYQALKENTVPIFWTLLFALLVVVALVYALATSGWF